MTRARYLADFKQDDGTGYATKYATGFSPQFSGTPTGISASHITTGVLPVGVTGGSGLDELANDVEINTSGAITTTGAFTSIGIDDNSNALALTIDSSGHTTPGADNTQDLGSASKRWGPVHGKYFASTPIYSGAATGFASGAAANAYHDITVADFGSMGGGQCWLVKMSWMNHNTTYGYTVQAMAIITSNGPNTHNIHYQGNVHWQRTTLGDNGGSFNGIICTHAVHTSSSALTVNMMISEEQNGATYPPLALHVKTNAAPTTTPQISIWRMIT